MKHLIKHLFVAFALLCSANIAVAQQQMPPIPVDPNVRIGKLDNGMTYYIRHNKLPENRADFYIAQKVGSILEEDNQRGLAHFLEHMCFNGTKNYPGDSMIEYLEKIGVKFGENLNAYTAVDETVYNISNVPVVREGIIDSCLLILHDWADDLLLEPEEIDKERGVIHEEWRTRTGAMMRMWETTFPEIYPNSKYAYRLPIGTMEVVDNFPYQALRDYYEKWYRPDQQGIVIVGDIDVDQVEAKIKKLFSPIKMPENAAVREYFPVADNNETIVSIAKDKEQPNTMIYFYNKRDIVPNEAKGNMDYLMINYAISMINQMMSTRLRELVQSANPPFIDAAAFNGNYLLAKTKDAFTGVAVCKDNGVDEALSTLTREIERARRYGFTPSEYARAKAEYLRRLESAFNEKDKQKNESYVNEYVRHFIDNEPIPGIENEYAIMNQIVPNVPVEVINSIFSQMITDNNNVIAIYCPDKEGVVIPTKEHILDVVKKTKAENITAYEDKVSDEPLMAAKPQGGKIVKEETGPFGTTLLTLSNGVKVVIKKTDFKADQIQMYAMSLGGTSLFPDSEIINIKALNDVVRLGGLGNFSAINLEKVLAGKKASATTFVGNMTEGVNGSCSPKDLETMLQLVYLGFTAPRVDMDAFKSYQTRTKAQLENMEANPMTAFSDSISVGLYNHHPRALSIKADMIDKIDYQKIMDMYKDRFSDASDFTFMFVGNIDPKEAAPLLAEYLGALPATNRKETFKDTNLDIRKGMYKNEFAKKLETPKATILTVYSGDCIYNLKNDLMMSMLSQVLNMVYTETVREKEGGTYGVSAQGQITKYPKETFTMQIYFDTDPNRREKMLDIVLEQIDKFVANGPNVQDFNKVKEFMQKKYNENIKENGYWLNILNEYYFTNVDADTDYLKTLDSITPKDLQEFAKQLFSQKNRAEIIMTAAE